MSESLSDAPDLEDPHAKLERALIDEYLQSLGYDPGAVRLLPEARRDALLKQASTYASSKLTEVESKVHFMHDIHGTHKE